MKYAVMIFFLFVAEMKSDANEGEISLCANESDEEDVISTLRK